MRRNVSLVADDGDVRVQIDAQVLSRNGLTRDEVERITTKLIRETAAGLRFLPFTDFGIENMRVRR